MIKSSTSILVILLLICSFKLKAQKIVFDTIAKNYYHKYQVDPETNKKNGFFEEYFNNKIITKGEFKFGIKNGGWKFYYQNEALQQKGIYVDGKKSGLWTYYYSDGNIACETPFLNGERNGIQKGRHPNGTKSFEAPFKNNILEGVVTYYFDNGKPEYTNTYINDSVNGLCKKYYSNGNIKEERYIKKQKRDSIYKFYYEDGTLWEEIIYKNGNPYNVINYNKPNGQKLNCCTLENGTGTMKFYDLEGKITSEVNYLNNKKNGQATYFENGILTDEGRYENDMYVGSWKEYYKTGELYSVINYESDLKNGKAIYYFKDGSISQEGTFFKDEREGNWIIYNQNKEINSELKYKNGQLDGFAKYYSKGKKISEGEYYYGEKINTWQYYNYKGKPEKKVDYGDKSSVDVTKANKYNDTPKKIAEEDKTLSIAEKMPSFMGGEQEMMYFIQKNIAYPNDAKYAGISGTVYIQFIVLSTGEIDKNIRVIRGVHPTLDEEALRIVSIMPRWNPGSQSGKPVSVTFNLPIKYSLR